MALQRLVIDGFGQLELNNVAFRRDGRIEAQCYLDATDFANIPAENGMLLAVDKINRAICLPTSAKAGLPIALNYTTEHMYDERTPGLKNFKLERGTFLPRMGYLAVGDLFTTNCVCYDDEEFEASAPKTAEDVFVEALDAIKTTKLYGIRCDNGAIKVTATATNADLLVVKKTTMPDGQLGIKFQAIK